METGEIILVINSILIISVLVFLLLFKKKNKVIFILSILVLGLTFSLLIINSIIRENMNLIDFDEVYNFAQFYATIDLIKIFFILSITALILYKKIKGKIAG